MKNTKRIIIVLLLTLAFVFPACVNETYRKSHVGGTNSAAISGSQSATPIGAKHTIKQYKHHNNSNKIQ